MFYPIADVQQKVGIRTLVENILDHLDTSAYSNKELSQILDTDKSTISRKLYQLKKNELVIPKFVE
jgi:predicted transcriptional regulator